jgi:hypothetical protein
MYQGHMNITRRLLTGFMEFFTYIELERYNSSFTQRKLQKVPIQYCPTDKWYQIYNSSSARKNMNLDANIAPVEMQWILPRISVNLINIVYDAERHFNKNNKLSFDVTSTTSTIQRVGVPYNLEIELSSISKNLDDAFQIMEQIIPFFSPTISIDVKLTDEIIDSVPIGLTSVSFDFPQEVSEEEERLYVVTYGFTMRATYYIKKSAPISVVTSTGINISSPSTDTTLPISIDGTQTLFAQYVNNSFNPNPLDGNTAFHDSDKVKLTNAGTWDKDTDYSNFDYVAFGNNKFIWIGGNVPNIEPGQPGWEKCWTLLSVIINSSINVHIDEEIKEEFLI